MESEIIEEDDKLNTENKKEQKPYEEDKVETITNNLNDDPLNEWMEIMNKEILIKKILEGSGTTASFGTIVKCNIKGYLSNPPNPPNREPFEDLKDQCFKIGEGDIFPGLELALRHSRAGEKFKLKCSSKYAYGPVERPEIKESNGHIIPRIPPDSPVEYEVEVTEHVDLESKIDRNSSTHDRDLTLLDVSLRKECGNRWYSYGDWIRASRAYSKGAEIAEAYLKSCQNETDEDNNDKEEETGVLMDEKDPGSLLLNAYVSCLNNLAACYLNRGENLKAKEVKTRITTYFTFRIRRNRINS
jgi:FKBP-type peptidyl-prolyl cis-trans isomerase